jgi:hypothetical protein
VPGTPAYSNAIPIAIHHSRVGRDSELMVVMTQDRHFIRVE